MNNKILGIGLGKTGTTSLGRAFELLGYQKHARYNLEALKLWKEDKRDELMEIVPVYEILEDYPWLFLYKEVYEMFPESKFILTKRKSPEIWFQSLCRHAERSGPTEGQKLIFGHYMPHAHKKIHIEYYENHIKDVMSFFSARDENRLLTINIDEDYGWKKICDFVQLPIPKFSFPYSNKTPEQNIPPSFVKRILKKMCSKMQ